MFNWQLLWDGYPHAIMRLSLKFFMLNQVRGFPKLIHSFKKCNLMVARDIWCLQIFIMSSLLDGLLASLLS